MGGSIGDQNLAETIIAGVFESTLPGGVEKEEWEIAKEWNSARVSHGVQTVSTFAGIDGL